MDKDIVVVTKTEYEILMHDSELANLTRDFLIQNPDMYRDTSVLRFIYGLSKPGKENA